MCLCVLLRALRFRGIIPAGQTASPPSYREMFARESTNDKIMMTVSTRKTICAVDRRFLLRAGGLFLGTVKILSDGLRERESARRGPYSNWALMDSAAVAGTMACNSSRLAARMWSMEPKCRSRALRRAGPMPRMASRREARPRLVRFLR